MKLKEKRMKILDGKGGIKEYGTEARWDQKILDEMTSAAAARRIQRNGFGNSR